MINCTNPLKKDFPKMPPKKKAPTTAAAKKGAPKTTTRTTKAEAPAPTPAEQSSLQNSRKSSRIPTPSKIATDNTSSEITQGILPRKSSVASESKKIKKEAPTKAGKKLPAKRGRRGKAVSEDSIEEIPAEEEISDDVEEVQDLPESIKTENPTEEPKAQPQLQELTAMDTEALPIEKSQTPEPSMPQEDPEALTSNQTQAMAVEKIQSPLKPFQPNFTAPPTQTLQSQSQSNLPMPEPISAELKNKIMTQRIAAIFADQNFDGRHLLQAYHDEYLSQNSRSLQYSYNYLSQVYKAYTLLKDSLLADIEKRKNKVEAVFTKNPKKLTLLEHPWKTDNINIHYYEILASLIYTFFKIEVSHTTKNPILIPQAEDKFLNSALNFLSKYEKRTYIPFKRGVLSKISISNFCYKDTNSLVSDKNLFFQKSDYKLLWPALCLRLQDLSKKSVVNLYNYCKAHKIPFSTLSTPKPTSETQARLFLDTDRHDLWWKNFCNRKLTDIGLEGRKNWDCCNYNIFGLMNYEELEGEGAFGYLGSFMDFFWDYLLHIPRVEFEVGRGVGAGLRGEADRRVKVFYEVVVRFGVYGWEGVES